MQHFFKTLGLGLTALTFSAGLAVADTPADPMQAIVSAKGIIDAKDPMRAAIVAPATEGEEKAGNPEYDGLPDGPGAEETYYTCVACHSTEIIKQQRVTDTRWDELWTWMIDSQGMIEPDEETKTLILAYLKQNFSSER